MYNLYQVQLEKDNFIYRFEIGTNDYDAVELAEIYIACELNTYGPFHVGGYDNIGETSKEGIVKFTYKGY